MSSHHEWAEEVIAEHDLKTPFAPDNGTPLQFKAGDRVIYTNEFGATFARVVTGLYKPSRPCSRYALGCRYLLNSSSPWSPVQEAELKPDTRQPITNI